jgi:hypothetical protein
MINSRVRILKYDLTPMFLNETGVVVGYSPLGNFCLVLLDKREYYMCPYPKWIKPEDLEVIENE